MNGKLILRLVEAALGGKTDQVKMTANMLSSELKQVYPELSKDIALITAPNGLRDKRSTRSGEITQPDTVNENALVQVNPLTTLSQKPIWATDTQLVIDQILQEHQYRDKLIKNGLEPIKSIIFTGPPGVGKTISAQWIAQELNLPLLVLDLGAVMSSYLGKTGSNLKSVIEYASLQPCVLLLDEFDSIAKKRGDDNDVGELKRLVTVLLQALDSWPSSSLLIAATNHPELLDPAVWRRFEEIITFENPKDEQIKKYLFDLTGSLKIQNLYPLFRNTSHSDISKNINKHKKISFINNLNLFEQLVTARTSEGILNTMSALEKKKLAIALVKSDISQRKVSTILNMSRPTISKALAEHAT